MAVGVPIRNHRDLIAWQRAMELAERVYAVATELPESERFSLSQQLRRAAVSVPSNIAEGHGRHSRKDYVKFLRIARGSLAELSTQLELATRLKLVRSDPQTAQLIEETDRILNALIRSLVTRTND
jgi:four helix bundle protein